MDLMTLAAKIVLDDSSYTKGITNAESMGQKLQGKMSAMTVAVGNLAADMIRKSVNGIQQVIGGAIDGYADYEQLIGGVETLFKDSANRVAQNAKKSFKTTGLSANQYMETVTSFSASLLQGLGGNTEEAAKLADVAITDMADNANKMGTDMSSIQAAYQGFAKQNYTMLDNLKLGYGGTQSEMIRLINDSKVLGKEIDSLDGVSFDTMISAIHEIQNQMGITGTTAKEAAETISGSKASLKAAWEDLLAAVGGAGSQNQLDQALENFKTSFSGYMTNFIPAMVETVANSGSLVEAVADAIGSLPTTLLSQVGEKGLEAGADMISGLTKVTSWLIDSVTEMFHSAALDNTAVVNLGAAIGDFLGTAISKIVTNAGTIFEGIIAVGEGLASGLVEGLINGLFGQGVYGDIVKAENEANEDILEAIKNNSKAQGILTLMDELIQKYGNAATETNEWKSAVAALNEVMPDANKLLEKQDGNLTNTVRHLREYANEMETLAIAEAKRKALETKQEALTNAQAALYGAEAGIRVNKAQATEAKNELLHFIREYGDQKDFSGRGMESKDVIDYAYDILREKIGAGNEGYEEAATKLKAWKETLTSSEKEVEDLKNSLPGLKQQVEFAEASYLTSSAAIDELTGAASGAAQALEMLKHPEMTYNSGQYYNWYYGNKGNKHAKGAWEVPYDDYHAVLHRGERVLTASQVRQADSGGSKIDFDALESAVVDAIARGMNNNPALVFLDSREITKSTNRNNRSGAMAGRFRT